MATTMLPATTPNSAPAPMVRIEAGTKTPAMAYPRV
jgi:hypothetical protein